MSSTCKIINEILYFFCIKCWKFSLYFILTAHLNLDWSRFKCSITACVLWLLRWAVQATEMVLNHAGPNAFLYIK